MAEEEKVMGGAAGGVQAAARAAQTQKATKKPTEYVVLRSDAATGPFTVVGTHTTQGQIAAKKAAAASEATLGNDPEKSFFVAVPASSFAPQKPVVQMVITFLTDDGLADEGGDDEDDDSSNDMSD